MKRLVVTGLPCPPDVWENFLGQRKDQRIIPVFEIFENTNSSDPRILAQYVQAEIEREEPDSIVCHDLGVPLVILSLLRMKKLGQPLRTCLTLFNGAFRGVDVLKASQPIRAQFLPISKLVGEAESRGGVVDKRLVKHMSRIRALYRTILFFELTEKVSSFLGLEEFFGLPVRFPLRIPIQMIVSENDPYIPWEAIERLRIDCGVRRFLRMDYGHFPYSSDPKPILACLDEFEALSLTSRRRARSRRAGHLVPRTSTQEIEVRV